MLFVLPGAPIWPSVVFPGYGVTSESLLLALPKSTPSGVLFYTIFYRYQLPDGAWSTWSSFDQVDSTDEFFTLRNLLADTLYEVYLRGSNTTHQTPSGASARQRTLPRGEYACFTLHVANHFVRTKELNET